MALLNVSFDPCNDDNLTLHLFIHGRQYEQIKDYGFCLIRKTSLHKQTLMFNTKYILYVSVLNFVSWLMFSIYVMHYISNFLCIISLTTKFVIYAVNFDWYREFIFNRCAISQQSGIRNKGHQAYLLIISCRIIFCLISSN